MTHQLFPTAALVRGPHGLALEGVALADIAAHQGTPTFVYSLAEIRRAYGAWRDALAGRDALVCYAVKANSNLGVLSAFARMGAGFDIVSGGELARVLAAGGEAGKVVFSGVGKSEVEMRQTLSAGIGCFNIESPSEVARLDAIARELGTRAPVALRVNPDVDARTHPYISTGLKNNKFGIAFDDAFDLYRDAAARPGLRVVGIACHIGSQLLDPTPMADATTKVLELVDRLAAAGIALEHIDLGGGVGIRYRDETPPTIAEYLAPILARLEGRREALHFEPGRSLVGNAGVLLTRVEYLKHGETMNFAVVDAAMNDLARPALYDAWHEVVEVAPHGEPQTYEVVGPICESGDFLAHERPLAVAEGDLLAILSAGAYGMTMSSNYNTRGRAAEVIVDGNAMHVVRERESVESLFALESRLPE
ncbi:diaminopimelate decarboxylase [Pseudazoarcus pumilus]|uniref:Diaminopimelate decarboxylase n=1 Tax=Pseudazoarcus pumilus TaxID=2067960 RepID=A0A2I6S2V8_9RHOO|nr:diaminopimelate decarboxylase [Pseudazoarcus pumilus]AUN93575.1 diaminopimelate decarboxylase [Pseudazoarcus pumilus]